MTAHARMVVCFSLCLPVRKAQLQAGRMTNPQPRVFNLLLSPHQTMRPALLLLAVVAGLLCLTQQSQAEFMVGFCFFF